MTQRRRLSERKSFGKLAKQGALVSFLRQSFGSILFFPTSMILARLLTPREFGIATAALFFIVLSSRLAELGFNAALVRAKVVTPVHLSTVFLVNMGVGTASCLVLTAVAPLVGRFYGVPETAAILPVAALGFLISPLGSVPAATLARDMRFKETTIIEWTQDLTFSCLAALLAWQGFSFWSLVYARLGASTVQTVLRFYFSRWRPSLVFSLAALREILSFAAGMHVRRLLDYGAQNLDNLLIGKLMGMTALGLYDKAFSMMARFLGRMHTGAPVMFRIFALIHEDPPRFRRAYSKVVMSASLIGVPVFAVLATTAPQVIRVLFGTQWRDAVAPFRVLCLVGILKMLNSYASAAIQASGHVWSEVWRQIAFIAMIVAFLVIFRHYGPLGGAFGVMLATLCMTILMHVLLRRISHLTWNELVQPLVPAVMCAVGTSGAVLLMQLALRFTFPKAPPWALLGCQIAIATVFYLVFIFFAPHRGLQSLVHEMTNDLAPSFVKRHPWVRAYLASSPDASNSATIA